jgi:tRNA G10  N-methylase Trm11
MNEITKKVKLPKLSKVLTYNQQRCICNFENSRLDKNIYIYDNSFNKFMNDVVLNILTAENISEILSNIESENIFYESFYFLFQCMYKEKYPMKSMGCLRTSMASPSPCQIF